VSYPKVSLEMASGSISRWLVADGQAVTSGQVIFEIDNDKAAVEVEAPADGILHHLVDEGEEVEVGDQVAAILADDEIAPVKADTAKSSDPADSVEDRQEKAVAIKDDVADAASESLAVPASGRHLQRPNPTPLARRIAREQGVSLTGISGTGPG